MPRFFTPLAIFAAIASAFFLYGVKNDTRAIEAALQAKERAIDKAQSDIAVLKAERAHLSRPERIEPIARAQGLSPPAGSQIVRTDVPARGRATTGALQAAEGRSP